MAGLIFGYNLAGLCVCVCVQYLKPMDFVHVVAVCYAMVWFCKYILQENVQSGHKYKTAVEVSRCLGVMSLQFAVIHRVGYSAV